MTHVDALIDEHREIDRLLDRLEGFVACDDAPDPLRLLQLRRELGRVLTRHIKREDWMLYPMLRSSRCPDVRALAARLGSEIESFGDTFAAYSRRWTSLDIAEDWLGYRADTAVMVKALRHRIVVEETELYPLLDVGERLAS